MADVPADIFFAPLTEINRRLVAGEFSCRDLTSAFCDRFEQLGPRYNAVALSFREQALDQASDVDGDLSRNRTRGPLQGIPYAVKDLLSVADHPTTWGARPLAGQVFDQNARVVDKLNDTGAILIGKLGMIELAGGGGYNRASASMQGPGRNPWDLSRWAGGSSSGCGSAVAAGLCSFAIGSETSGSIITPSAFCGVTGLRPTFGKVSRRGAMPLAWSLDKLGPMGRTAEDCALILQQISGSDTRNDADATGGFRYTPQFNREPQEITVGYAPVDFEEWADPATRSALEDAIGVIRDQGFNLQEVALPDFPYGAILGTVLAGEAASVFEDFIRSGQVDQLADPEQIAGLKAYLELPATEYLKAQRIRSMVQDELRSMMFDTQVFLAPARYGVAPPIDQPLDQGLANLGQPSAPGMSGLIPASNLAGLPGISIPCGFADGLPVGLQLVGRPNYENQIVQIAKAFQDTTDFHTRRPPTT